jgi:hypothetical protein
MHLHARLVETELSDLFDLAQCAASVLVTVREGRRAGFGGPAVPSAALERP